MIYWPIIVTTISIATAGVGGYINLLLKDQALDATITTINSDVIDNYRNIDNNEEAIEDIQKILIRRQGQQELQMQKIQSNIDKQGTKLDQLLDILQELEQD